MQNAKAEKNLKKIEKTWKSQGVCAKKIEKLQKNFQRALKSGVLGT